MSQDFAGLDIAVGSVFGSRCWKVDAWGRLTGISYAEVWRPGENEAVCKRRPPTEAEVTYLGVTPYECQGLTDPKCGCGFWAYYDGQTASADTAVAGIIEGFGSVQIGSKGFRAKKATIRALAAYGVSSSRRRLIERNYPDVAWFPTLDEAIDAYPLTLDYLPSPDNTDDFWTRDIIAEDPVLAAYRSYLASVSSKMSVWETSTSVTATDPKRRRWLFGGGSS